MIQISLIVHGKTKTYKAGGVNRRTSLEAYDLYKEYTDAQGDYPKELIDRLNAFVCSCFGSAFSEEELLDGYKGSAFQLYPGILSAVISYVHEEIVNFPTPAEEPAKKTANS